MVSQTLIMIIAMAILIALAAIGLGLFVFLRQKPAGTETASLELSELRGQLAQLAQLSQQQQQGHVEQMASLSKGWKNHWRG